MWRAALEPMQSTDLCAACEREIVETTSDGVRLTAAMTCGLCSVAWHHSCVDTLVLDSIDVSGVPAVDDSDLPEVFVTGAGGICALCRAWRVQALPGACAA